MRSLKRVVESFRHKGSRTTDATGTCLELQDHIIEIFRGPGGGEALSFGPLSMATSPGGRAGNDTQTINDGFKLTSTLYSSASLSRMYRAIQSWSAPSIPTQGPTWTSKRKLGIIHPGIPVRDVKMLWKNEGMQSSRSSAERGTPDFATTSLYKLGQT